MDILLLYYVLLILWIPLLWPAFRLRGWKRWLMVLAVSMGALAAASEVWQAFGEPNAIRLDIILFSFFLILLYVAAVAVLFLAGWRTAATLTGLVVAIAGGGILYSFAETAAESERLTQKFDERNRLMFEARFRDRAIYDAYFGPFDGGATGRFPAGHWEAPERARFTRLIVNGEGDAWLFYRCSPEAECFYRPSDRPLERAADGALREWRGELRPPVGEAMPVRIVQREDNTLTLFARNAETAFSPKPPPIAAERPKDTLDFVGTFLDTECVGTGGKHVAVRQLSLWRQGDALFAVGIYRTLLAGHHARFVTPWVMGEGRRAGAAWEFDWKIEGEPASAKVALEDDMVRIALALPRGKPVEATLRRGAVFADETIDLAPRTTVTDWSHWFDTVWVGQFLSGRTPSCPSAQK
jgi:hypothetical protein